MIHALGYFIIDSMKIIKQYLYIIYKLAGIPRLGIPACFLQRISIVVYEKNVNFAIIIHDISKYLMQN